MAEHEDSADGFLQALAAEPLRSGLFLDFDGTLTPIIDDPAQSELPPELRPILQRLARELGLLAVVSGRPAAFLAERAAIPRARLLGLYGLEEWRDGQIHVRPEAGRWQAAVDEAKRRLAAAVEAIPGARVEDKGLGVAVHWRGAADLDAAEQAVGEAVREVAEHTGLAREPGKLVEELRPPVEWDKGSAVRALAGELNLQRVAYVGDDRGDLPAFDAVRELEGWAVAVDHGEETPAALKDRAHIVVDGAPGAAELLAALSDRLTAP